jgi:ADP-ribosylglycohydrolase
MTSTSPGTRARNCLLAAAMAGNVVADAGEQPLLFEAPPLSNDLWLALATCEAIARAGGRIGGDRAAVVLKEWFDARRFQNPGADSMEPLRDLAAGVDWRHSGSSDDAARAAAIVRAAPLAFVIDAQSEVDRTLLSEVVSITCVHPHVADDARVMVAAMQRSLTEDAVPDARSIADLSTLEPSLSAALQCASSSAGDLEASLRAAAACDNAATVRVMIGLLLGAAGCEIPSAMVSAIPERAAVEAIIEPFAEFVEVAGAP